MTPISEIIEELKRTIFRKFHNQGLIEDEILEIHAFDAIKNFGRLATVLREKTFELKNNKAELPQDFYSVADLRMCKPDGYYIESGNKDDLIQSRTWRESLYNNTIWDSCEPCCKQECSTRVVENFYTRGNSVQYYFLKDKPFKFTKKFLASDRCTADCKNRYVTNSPYTAYVEGRTLYTNTNGYVLLTYYAFPTNDDGDLLIPDSQKGTLLRFVKDYIAWKVLEEMVFNGDNDVAQLYQVKKQEAEMLYRKVLSELISEVVDKQSVLNYVKLSNFRRKQQEYPRYGKR